MPASRASRRVEPSRTGWTIASGDPSGAPPESIVVSCKLSGVSTERRCRARRKVCVVSGVTVSAEHFFTDSIPSLNFRRSYRRVSVDPCGANARWIPIEIGTRAPSRARADVDARVFPPWRKKRESMERCHDASRRHSAPREGPRRRRIGRRDDARCDCSVRAIARALRTRRSTGTRREPRELDARPSA